MLLDLKWEVCGILEIFQSMCYMMLLKHKVVANKVVEKQFCFTGIILFCFVFLLKVKQ